MSCFLFRLQPPQPRSSWRPQTLTWDGEAAPPRRSRSSMRALNPETFGKALEDRRTNTTRYLMMNTPMTGHHEFGTWKQNTTPSKPQRLCAPTGQPPHPTLCLCCSQTSTRPSNQVGFSGSVLILLYYCIVLLCTGSLRKYLHVSLTDHIEQNNLAS